MSLVKHAIISAAGMGTRIGLNIPKCLLRFDGVTLIEHQLSLLKEIEDIRIVVGFMEESVMKIAKSFRKDILFVRNPHYQTTSNTYSISLATRSLNNPYILMDGDLLINKSSFHNFIKSFDGKKSIIGVTKSTTDDAVYVNINKNNFVTNFDRKTKGLYEWTGIACLNKIKITDQYPYLYQSLEKHLPLKSNYIECSEIDTPGDLNRAQNFWFKNLT